jgi:uncharacterized protein (TIGR01319 family)
VSISIFIDFGSTFTKVVALDTEREELAARVQAPSTASTDVMTGLNKALKLLAKKIPVSEAEVKKALACSSAAGGLRIACIGLVPEYTTEAGRLAALGAGAKIVGTFSYELSKSEINELEVLKPDIILLTGGTDGGNKQTIIHNARLLSKTGESLNNIIVAGNKSALDDIHEHLDPTGKSIIYTKNVMPEFGVLDIAPVNQVIRNVFIERITEAKGISRANSLIGGVVMPTPAAVLQAVTVLSSGTYSEAGLGELLAVDVGGATTDVYSVGYGAPQKTGVSYIGLNEPYVKRTVEGDLGLYHNLDTLIDMAKKLHLELEGTASYDEVMNSLKSALSVPKGEEQSNNQLLLSRLAVAAAVERHAGRLDLRYTANGEVWVQRGKDLRYAPLVLGSGGPLAFSSNPRYALEGAAEDKAEINGSSCLILKPKQPRYILDKSYILYAIGLLSFTEPEKALRIFKKNMTAL